MSKRNTRYGIYIKVMGLSLIFALVGLWFYVRTIPLNETNQKLAIQIQQMKEDNRRLELDILSRSNLKAVESIAEDHLHMHPAQHPHIVIVTP
jgi:cell division protein FtsL